jgi:putative transcriptional regulator
MPKAKIDNIIRKLRFENGELTQQALALEVGCTRQTIILLEHGKYAPSLALALRIARVFNRSVDQVFQLKE